MSEKFFRVRDPKTGLWVAPNPRLLSWMIWTEKKEEAEIITGDEVVRKFWESQGLEVVEVER